MTYKLFQTLYVRYRPNMRIIIKIILKKSGKNYNFTYFIFTYLLAPMSDQFLDWQ